MRTGIGYDIHRLRGGRKLVLGGIEVDFPRGLEGHSDADVLTHAICDALLGAAGEGDIGRHFPDTDERYRDISSLKILEKVSEMVGAKGLVIKYIDATVILEQPHLSPYIPKMEQALVRVLGVEAGQLNIKATTNEKIGAIGRGEAIAALAVASLEADKLRIKEIATAE